MPARPRNALLDQLEDLDDPTPKDFDPEDEPSNPDSDAGGEDGGAVGSDDAQGGREHYVGVGKSKLRKPERVSLGPRYAGSRVSRDTLLAGVEEDDDDDPFAKGFGEGDSAASEEEDEDGGSAEESDASESGSADDDDDDDDDSGAAEEETSASSVPKATADVLQAFTRGNKSSKTQQARLGGGGGGGAVVDAEKGRAVRKQRATFDALLNARIKLQKALIGANTLAGLAQDRVETDVTEANSTAEEEGAHGMASAYEAAESAAFNLWTSLTSLRTTLLDSRSSGTGTKRDHDTAFPTSDTPLSTLWSTLHSQDKASKTHEDETLSKWYRKTHETELFAAQGRNSLVSKGSSGSVQNVITDALADRSRLLKRARTPRSCAPYQLGRVAADRGRRTKQPSTRPDPQDDNDDADEMGGHQDIGDATVYDDADFYSVLLTTLLEQRSSGITTTSTGAGASAAGTATTAVDLSALNGYQIRREAKTKRAGVDTKASKGRKLRYTVHEKLLDYMAPEDRGRWGQRQIDDLFGSLLGRRMVLDENEDEASDGEEVGHAVDGGMGDVVVDRALLFGR